MLLLYMYKIQHQNSPELNKSSLTKYVMFVIVLYVISFQLLESNFPLCSLCLCLYVFCKFIHEKSDTVMIRINGVLLYDKLHYICTSWKSRYKTLNIYCQVSVLGK